jgi:hypothetical protein
MVFLTAMTWNSWEISVASMAEDVEVLGCLGKSRSMKEPAFKGPFFGSMMIFTQSFHTIFKLSRFLFRDLRNYG